MFRECVLILFAFQISNSQVWTNHLCYTLPPRPNPTREAKKETTYGQHTDLTEAELGAYAQAKSPAAEHYSNRQLQGAAEQYRHGLPF